MRVVTISSKNQISLPISLLRELNLKPKNKVLVKRADGYIMLEPIQESIVEELAGSLTKYVDRKKLGKSFSEIMLETKKRSAARLAKK